MMTNQQRRVSSSRRRFLREAGIASIVAASGLGSNVLALGADPKPVPNLAKRLNLEIRPDYRSNGGVLVIRPRGKFLTFNALRGKDILNSVEAGTAVIELKGCQKTRFRHPGGEPNAADASLADALDLCEIYEVENSTWLQGVQSTLPKRSRTQPKVRHFVFTFLSTSFECLADGLNVKTSAKPFLEIVASL